MLAAPVASCKVDHRNLTSRNLVSRNLYKHTFRLTKRIVRLMSMSCINFLAVAFISALVISALAGTVHFGLAQTGTNVTGIISSDTTWTTANSPYTLTGPVAVNSGVTLTIEPGVTVSLASYYMIVNGTLIAQGTGTDPIYFNNGSTSHAAITLNSFSILENAVFSTGGISIYNGSPKIDNDSISSVACWSGSPVISNNIITVGLYVYSDSPEVLNNTIVGIISVQGGSPVISYNTIAGQSSMNDYPESRCRQIHYCRLQQ